MQTLPSPNLSIIIPTLNEEQTISSSLTKLLKSIGTDENVLEILVCDNGSTDQTLSVVRKAAEHDPRIRFISLPERGPGRAFVAGVQAARGEFIVTLDADLSSDLAFIRYAQELLKYSDMVVGSKTFGRQRRTLLRVLASQSYILSTQYLFDISISDFSMGAKAFRRESILPALPHLDHWTGYILELALFLGRRERKIIQIGIDCNDERVSRFSLLHEGFYRFRHLYRCFHLLRDPKSWLNMA